MNQLPANFGDGWLTDSAHDLLALATSLGGFPVKETCRAVALAGKPGRKTNAATVERVLADLDEQLPGYSREDLA